MFRVLGNTKQLCDGLTRRDLLQAGGASLLGLGLSDLLAADTPSENTLPAPAKNVIILFLYGGASQLDTFDPKPDAPDDIRGPFGSIPTAVPGVRVNEHLPRIAQMMDKVSLVRSMSHPHPIHGVAYAVTGIGRVDIPMELNPYDPRHWPSIGSVLDYLSDTDLPEQGLPAVPRVLHLPWVQSSRSHPHRRAGFFGGFLGPRYNPVVAEFNGSSTNPNTYRPDDPFGGVGPDCRFEINNTALPPNITVDRLSRRQSLLEQFDNQNRHLDESQAGESLNRTQQMALSVMTSPRLRTALDLNREAAPVRERYGYHLFGQSALLARRLIEAGSRLVSVVWDEFGLSCGAWDTHERQTDRLSRELCPGVDQTLSALLEDLQQRGLFDDTLVLCMTEHGRTPNAERRNGVADGRNHWSQAYSILLAGAGINQGHVVGSSDSRAAYVSERPVTPKDILHTVYHLLGIDSHRTIADRLGRPIPLVAEGEIVHELLG